MNNYGTLPAQIYLPERSRYETINDTSEQLYAERMRDLERCQLELNVGRQSPLADIIQKSMAKTPKGIDLRLEGTLRITIGEDRRNVCKADNKSSGAGNGKFKVKKHPVKLRNADKSSSDLRKTPKKRAGYTHLSKKTKEKVVRSSSKTELRSNTKPHACSTQSSTFRASSTKAVVAFLNTIEPYTCISQEFAE
eukprot:TRINITY_DN22465_c0_g1_i1.p1 TRINITY_DN22465_c0_g1~~TRINITY_DN22465_c0_g1_i1.p1  ORF type:complete len:194 (-),score=21.17 TRINITY_DN22465_c0_g1_i1:427-1008(-)